ncbi:MAG: 3-deoxy-manno-octulosonate cytidylyltransferase [Ignavibacteriales bacterium]|nr:3-deoxy-manno-octulosonate cytidylyltransferase [Ignavibacteriales bacterium]
METRKVIGVIPARYASQRLPAKPLVDLLGKSMIQRVFEQAKKATSLHRVIVATDDRRIEEAVKAFGGEVAMTSPEIKSGSDRVAAVAQREEGEIFVNIQGDEPLIVPAMIDEVVRVVLDDPQADVGTLVKTITSESELINPGVVKVVLDTRGRALYFSRSVIPWIRDSNNPLDWLKHHPFYKHIGLYVFRRESLLRFTTMPEGELERAEKLEQLRILEGGSTIKAGLTQHDSIPVDTQEDVERVLMLIRQQEKA